MQIQWNRFRDERESVLREVLLLVSVFFFLHSFSNKMEGFQGTIELVYIVPLSQTVLWEKQEEGIWKRKSVSQSDSSASSLTGELTKVWVGLLPFSFFAVTGKRGLLRGWKRRSSSVKEEATVKEREKDIPAALTVYRRLYLQGWKGRWKVQKVSGAKETAVLECSHEEGGGGGFIIIRIKKTKGGPNPTDLLLDLTSDSTLYSRSSHTRRQLSSEYNYMLRQQKDFQE